MSIINKNDIRQQLVFFLLSVLNIMLIRPFFVTISKQQAKQI